MMLLKDRMMPVKGNGGRTTLRNRTYRKLKKDPED